MWSIFSNSRAHNLHLMSSSSNDGLTRSSVPNLCQSAFHQKKEYEVGTGFFQMISLAAHDWCCVRAKFQAVQKEKIPFGAKESHLSVKMKRTFQILRQDADGRAEIEVPHWRREDVYFRLIQVVHRLSLCVLRSQVSFKVLAVVMSSTRRSPRHLPFSVCKQWPTEHD